MRPRLTALFAALAFALPTGAEEMSLEEMWRADPGRFFDATEVDAGALQWVARPVIVFANSPRDPAFIEQIAELQDGLPELIERDVIIIVDTDPAAASELRQQLRPRGFMLALVGKDGQIKLRKPLPWTVREISRSIDKMPMRQGEVRGR